MGIALTTNKDGLSNAASAASISLAFPSNVASGSLLVAIVHDFQGTPPATGVAKSDGSNQFTRAAYTSGGTGWINTGIYFLPNAPAGAFTVKYTPSASTYLAISIIEITGAALTNVFDNSQVTASMGNSLTPEPDANVTYAGNAAVVQGWSSPASSAPTITPGTGFTLITKHEDGLTASIFGSEAMVVSGSGNTRAYQTISVAADDWSAAAASFKEATAGGDLSISVAECIDAVGKF